jgi:hypothetical protein
MSPGSPTRDLGQAPLGGGPPAQQKLIAYFYHPAGDGTAGAWHKLLVFRRESIAVEEFADLQAKAFTSRRYSWIPIESEAISSHASSSDLRCTMDRSEPTCRHLSRYGLVVSDLSIDLYGTNSDLIPIPVVSEEDVLVVVGKLDSRLSEYAD